MIAIYLLFVRRSHQKKQYDTASCFKAPSYICISVSESLCGRTYLYVLVSIGLVMVAVLQNYSGISGLSGLLRLPLLLQLCVLGHTVS